MPEISPLELFSFGLTISLFFLKIKKPDNMDQNNQSSTLSPQPLRPECPVHHRHCGRVNNAHSPTHQKCSCPNPKNTNMLPYLSKEAFQM